MRKILLTLALLLPAAAFAQTTYDDGVSFGARATVEADAKLAKGLHLTAHEHSSATTAIPRTSCGSTPASAWNTRCSPS